MDYTKPTVPFDPEIPGYYGPSGFPYFERGSAENPIEGAPTEYPLDTNAHISFGRWYVDAQYVTPVSIDGILTWYTESGPFIRYYYYDVVSAELRQGREHITRIFWVGDNVKSYNFEEHHNPPAYIRPYELRNDEIDLAEEDYFLQYGYSHSARDGVHAGLQVIHSVLLKTGLTQEKRDEYRSLICQINHLLVWENAVYRVSHLIKKMSPRPEFKHDALGIYNDDVTIPDGLTDKISAVLESTNLANVISAHNLVWTGDDQIPVNEPVADTEEE